MSQLTKICLIFFLLTGASCSILRGLTGSDSEPAALDVAPQGAGVAVSNGQPEPFAEAVRLATGAANLAQTAQTTEEWGQVGVKWDEAAQFMLKVPENHEQYSIAQDRIPTYQKNRDDALTRAGLLSP